MVCRHALGRRDGAAWWPDKAVWHIKTWLQSQSIASKITWTMALNHSDKRLIGVGKDVLQVFKTGRNAHILEHYAGLPAPLP